MLLYPERTVKSVKRLMGSNQSVTLGDKTFTPPEISALILRELARWAEVRLGTPVKKAVITVPAYFSDAQRNATREAGELAGPGSRPHHQRTHRRQPCLWSGFAAGPEP